MKIIYVLFVCMFSLVISSISFAEGSSVAFASAARKNSPTDFVCVEEAKRAAVDLFYKTPGNKYKKNLLDDALIVMVRKINQSANQYKYSVDVVDQFSDGASSDEFTLASYDVLVRSVGQECEVLSARPTRK